MKDFETEELASASLIKRLLATVYDLFPLFGVAFLYTAIAMAILSLQGVEQTHLTTEMIGEDIVMRADNEFQPALHGPIFRIGLGVALLGFYVFFWLRSGQTLGMQAWRIKLVSQNGEPLKLGTVVLRALLGLPSLLLFGLGYLWILFNPKRLAVHDLITKTRVVQLPKKNKKKKSAPPQGE